MRQEFPNLLSDGSAGSEQRDGERSDSPEKRANDLLDKLERENRFEVLYYHPGYITPEEFFHRMFLSVQRLKQHGGSQGSERKLTVLFNSLDQLSARFPLCARQEIFIPGIVECLTCEGVTSIFIAVDEKGQPLEQYGLLPMADLIISFTPQQFRFEDYASHMEQVRRPDPGDLRFRGVP